MLLKAEDLQQRLSEVLGATDRIWIYSAFLTLPGMSFVLRKMTNVRDCRLTIRAELKDVIDGSLSLDAVSHALDAGFMVKVSSALHAKIYLSDSSMFVGSSNLTASGLSLCSDPNEELNIEVEPSTNDLKVLQNIWDQGCTLDHAKLKEMQSVVERLGTKSEGASETLVWPAGMWDEDRDIYCSDFPQVAPKTGSKWCDEGFVASSRAYAWLFSALQAKGSMSFGQLSAELHTCLYDDPAPYRRTVKDLLANFLSGIEQISNFSLIVERPSHSQVVRVRESELGNLNG